MNIEDIANSKWIILHAYNTFYNRIIARVISVRFCYEQFDKKYYLLNCAIAEDFQSFRLIQYNNEFFVNVVFKDFDKLFSIQLTDNILSHLCVGDTLIFKDIDSNNQIYNTKAKVTKIQEKYKRILVNIFGESKNLTSVLKKYGTIHAIKTSDVRYLIEENNKNTKE